MRKQRTFNARLGQYLESRQVKRPLRVLIGIKRFASLHQTKVLYALRLKISKTLRFFRPALLLSEQITDNTVYIFEREISPLRKWLGIKAASMRKQKSEDVDIKLVEKVLNNSKKKVM